MKYRLGLDMGATSIGWSVYNIDNNTIEDFGVRIFDDGREDKTKAPLCVKRRNARGLRRLNNRKHIQTNYLLQKLTEYGLLPEDETQRKSLKLLNPYELRAKALDEKIDIYAFGRILLQLSKRKGFKSNRKDDKEEGGKLKKGYQDLLAEMQNKNARTYGEYLYKIHLENPKADLRLKNTFDETGKFKGGLFPFRETYKDEFHKIWDNQKEYYPDILTDKRKQIIEDILYFQRPLKEQEEGLCSFEPNERRIPKSHPLFQEFRICQYLLDLTFCCEQNSEYSSLEYNTQNKLISILQNPINQKVTKQGTIAYSNIKKELGLDKNGVFNFEKTVQNSEYEKGMIVNKTQNAINQSVYFKPYWDSFSDKQKSDIINTLARPQCYITFPKRLSSEDEDKIIIDYLCKNYALSCEAAKELLFDIQLEDGFGSLSQKAIEKILPHMKNGIPYTDACLEAGYHHSKKDYSKIDRLPYYGKILENHCLGKKVNYKNEEEQYGRISNATVHIALNQIRYIVNELIDLYGKPFDISVEYSRDLNASTQERSQMAKNIDENEQENRHIADELTKKTGIDRIWNKRDIQKYKIWKQMGIAKGGNVFERECPFTGKIISVSDLLNGNEFQIEHLIPFSRSLDDSLNNKVIACTSANRYKANRTPFEAFGESKDGYNWSEIQKRAKKLNYEQQWRFSKDAMTKFETQQGPIARSLNDTRYMTKILQEYLLPIVREDGMKTVQSIVGKLTAMIRKSWGLNLYKNKDDEDYRAFHNHHAIDALIASAINRGNIEKTARDLKRVALSVQEEFNDELYKFKDTNTSSEEKKELHKRIKDFILQREECIVASHIPLPESINISDIIKRVEKINISHKPKLKNIKDPNSTIGKLHEDTAYGLKDFKNETDLIGIFENKGDKQEKSITDYIPMFYNKEDKNQYYNAFKNWFIISGKSRSVIANTKDEKEIKKNLGTLEQETVQTLREASKKAFKWFIGGGNFCAEIYQINPQNKINGLVTNDQNEWKSEIISNYNATIREKREENIAYWKYKYPNAKRIMTIKRNDMIMATFSRDQAYNEKFPKGIQEYVRAMFEEISTKETVDVLFRLKKINSSGTLTFTPHNIAKEDADTKSWLASAGSMQKYSARKVHISSTGRISYAK